jgi:hypothetical protein
MFILYVDDSGSIKNADEEHFVLAGLAVFEQQIYYLINDLDQIVSSFGIGPHEQIELHGSHMYSGKTMPWRGVKSKEDRAKMIQDALRILLRASTNKVKAFGVVVEKKSLTSANPIEFAFEEICNRFNLFLSRYYQNRGGREEDKQKGLIVMDESHHEQPLQALAQEFRVNGTRWGNLRNIAEVPLFVDSRASRLIQLADLIAYSMWRKYEFQDGRFLDPITGRFDADGGVIHGMVHWKPKNKDCWCPACMSRALRIESEMPKKIHVLSDEERAQRIAETAEVIETSNDPEDFERAFGKIAPPKLTEAPPPESVEKRKSKVNLTKKQEKS